MGAGDCLAGGDIEVDGVDSRIVGPGRGFGFGGIRYLGQRQQAGRHQRECRRRLEHRRVDQRVGERIAPQCKSATRADLQGVAEMINVIVGERRQVQADLDVGGRLVGGERAKRQGQHHQLVARRTGDDARRAGAVDGERMGGVAGGIEGQHHRFHRSAQEGRRSEADAIVDGGTGAIPAGRRQYQVDIRRKPHRAAGIGIGDVVEGQGDAERTPQWRRRWRGDRHAGFGIEHDAVLQQHDRVAAGKTAAACVAAPPAAGRGPQPARQPAADMRVGGHLPAVAGTRRYVGSSRPPASSRAMS